MASEASTAHSPQRDDPISFLENTLWRWLNSLPVATLVMILLALLSALGTFIPQEHLLQGPDSLNQAQFYTERFGEARYGLIKFLGLTHIYFTPYFFILLVWLCVSAVVCNITRFRRTLKAWRTPQVERTLRGFTHDKRAIVVEGTPAESAAALTADLEHHGYRVREQQVEGGSTCIYADRGFIKKWALVLLHFSLIVLLFGAIYGKTVGVQGWIKLPDGATRDLVLDVKEGKRNLVQPLIKWIKPITYTLSQDRFRIDYDEHVDVTPEMAHMPPEAQEYYRYFVKDFVSILTVTQGSRKKTQEVKVNHPLVLNKLVLYQSDYTQDGYLLVTGPDGHSDTYPAAAGQWLVLTPAGPEPAETAMGAGQPLSDYAFRLEPIKEGDLYRQGTKAGRIGPMSLLHLANINTEVEALQIIDTQRSFKTTLMDKQYTVQLAPKVDNSSGFSYKRDPGIPILYFGWIAMIIGITLSLYLPFTQIWLRVETGRVFMLAAPAGGMRAARTLYARWRDILMQP
jgi:cytochrome c biogenesis protein